MDSVKFSLKYRMLLLIATMVLAQLALVWTASRRSKALLNSLDQVVSKQLPASNSITIMDMYHDGIRAVVLEGLFAAEKQKPESIAEALREASEKKKKILESVESLLGLSFSTERLAALGDLKKRIESYADQSIVVLKNLQKGETEKVFSSKAEFDRQFEALEEDLETERTALLKEANAQGDDGKDIMSSIFIYAIIGFVLSLYVGGAVFFGTKRCFDALTSKLIATTEEIFRLASILKEESGKVKDASLEQAAAVQESVSALSEMSSMIAQTGQNVKLSLETSSGTKQKAEEGKKIMDRMSNSMQSIQSASEKVQDLIKVIGDINSKTAVINDIVFKTQLLSFNASIEAARAGQHGRGFAVVAEEVGNLADLSGNAAKEIEALLEESNRKVKESVDLIQTRIEEGNRVSSTTVGTFNGISKSVEEIDQQVRAINEATQQQEIGIQQSNTAMKQIDASAQSNTHASNQAHETSEYLSTQCDALQEVTRSLIILTQGNKTDRGMEAIKGAKSNYEGKSQSPGRVKEGNSERGKLADLARKIIEKKEKAATTLTVAEFTNAREDEISADDPDFRKVA